ncbi:ATP-binding protein [Actinoallomurus purpureus]|uniref:ATP-binding protein n=1 Tax=Actinoallomurus purpureus TaxID=478114 RepID=UPI00209294A9|nr:ATP-binding protein [Actinoallomurus purpureus]MCO6003639.1 ATP-binding protein [Actinoallomurus purpureus]
MNPFEIPGAADSHNAPLTPWKNPAHIDYYVDVDSCETAFKEFQRVFHDTAALRNAGGLVLVTGPPGCGKTSLINRCAHWLHTESTAAEMSPHIVDLSRRVPRNFVIEKRMRAVYEMLLRDQNRTFSQEVLKSLEECYDDLWRGYLGVGDALGPQRLLLILLPVSELLQEVRRYAEVVHQRLVFFVESSDPVVAAAAGSLQPPPETRVAHLSVGSLQPGDGRRFSMKRAGDDGAACVPPLRLEAAERLLRRRREKNNSLTIGQLQRYLYGVYKEIGEKPASSIGAVNYNKIADYIASQVQS